MFVDLIHKNLFGLTTFIQKLITHDGDIKPERLYAATYQEGKYTLSNGKKYPNQSQYAVGMGAEICNSFCTLYEMGSFFQALFLAAVGSIFIREQWLDKLRQLDLKTQENEIQEILLNLTKEQLAKGLKNPLISLVVCLDTDVDAVRYNKHELWGLDPSIHHKRVSTITAEHYGVTPIAHDHNFQALYWTEKDAAIAEEVKRYKLSLPKIKALQLQMVFGELCRELDLDINNIPLYYSFLPKEDILKAGPNYSYLDVLVDLQTFEQKKKYRSITGIDQPWIVTASCQHCGQSSKTILSSKLTTYDSIKVTCRAKEYTFLNEAGYALTLKGCGKSSFYPICSTPNEMYQFIKENDISIHFAARELLYLLKDSSFNPICFVQGDLGVIKDDNDNLIIDKLQPKNYGDSRDMIGSMLAVRRNILHNDSLLNRYLKAINMLGDYNEIMFAYDGPTQLIDKKVMAHSGSDKYVSDTSALKQLSEGVCIESLFRKSVNLFPFTYETMMNLKSDTHKSPDSVSFKY